MEKLSQDDMEDVEMDGRDKDGDEAGWPAEKSGGGAMPPSVHLMCMAIGLFEMNNASSTSFMPSHYKSRGVTQAQIGMMLGVGAVGLLCVTPAMPTILRKFGGAPKVFIVVGWLFVASRMVFAMTGYLTDPTLITALATTAFALQFAVASAIEVCGSTIVLASVDNTTDRTKANGLLQGGRCLGALCGPIVGGYLYETIGFTPTVASIAAALGLLMLWATSMLRSMQAYGDDSASDSDGKSSGMCGLLRIPSVAITCALTFLGGCGLFYPAAYLQPGLKAAPYELSEHVIGGVLAAGMFGTIWGAISAGILIERVRGAMTMAVAFVVMSLGFLFLGPSMIEPFHSLPAQMWVPAVATFLTNFAFGIVTTCAPTMVLAFAEASGLKSQEAGTATLGIFFCGASLLPAPVIGGYLADTYGMSVASTSSCVLWLIAIALSFVLWFIPTRGSDYAIRPAREGP